MKLILLPVSYLFRIGVFIRNTLYNSGVLKTKALNTKIISIGNISAGGTGKTPFVELIAKYLLSKGRFIVIVLKGYKREHDDIKVVEAGFKNEKGELSTESLGDEAFIYLENLGGETDGRGLIVVGDDKTKAAKFASSKFKPEIMIVDDGFQHRKLHRDLDIVILNPGTSRQLIPAGRLREPLKNINRANIVVVNNKFNRAAIAENTGSMPRVICSYTLEGFFNAENQSLQQGERAITAFCGIGEPASFKQLLADRGFNISNFIKFPDHHSFTNDDIKKIITSFESSGAKYIFTTQKDFVRIKNSELVLRSVSDNPYKSLLFNYPLYYAKIKMQIDHNEELLYNELDDLINAA